MGRLKVVTAPAGAAVIHGKNHKTLLRHHFVPQHCGSLPLIEHDLSVRPAIDINKNGITAARVEVWRPDDLGVEGRAVSARNGEKFNRLQMVNRQAREPCCQSRDTTALPSALYKS